MHMLMMVVLWFFFSIRMVTCGHSVMVPKRSELGVTGASYRNLGCPSYLPGAFGPNVIAPSSLSSGGR